VEGPERGEEKVAFIRRRSNLLSLGRLSIEEGTPRLTGGCTEDIASKCAAESGAK